MTDLEKTKGGFSQAPRPLLSLNDCNEFRQTLLARPPRLVHATFWLLAGLVATALVWAALVQADLVVKATGRVRPVGTPRKVFRAARADVLGPGLSGRVAAVHVRPGDLTRKGDVLIQLDTQRLDNEIARRQSSIRTGEEELANLASLLRLQQMQLAAGRAKAKAELAQAESEVQQERRRLATEVATAEAELASINDELSRSRRLARLGAASTEAVIKAQAQAEVAQAKLRRAKLPVDDGKIKIAREALVVLESDAAVKREELLAREALKKGEVEAARLELANLELERHEAVLLAPIDGVVTSGEVRVGDILEAGKPVLEMAEQTEFIFEVLVPSEDVAHLRVGMPARVKVDAYDYQRYGTLPGTVSYVAPDSTMEQGGAAYQVRITLEQTDLRRGELFGVVKLGMAGRAEIQTERRSLLSLLGKQVRQSISLE